MGSSLLRCAPLKMEQGSPLRALLQTLHLFGAQRESIANGLEPFVLTRCGERQEGE
jgi:hypothetical protein